MQKFSRNQLRLLSVAAIAALLAVPLAQRSLSAQETPTQQMVVGTYQPQQVAERSGAQAKLTQQMTSLQQQMQQAQQQGNQADMQRLQAEAQRAQQAAAQEFQAEITSVIPEVAQAEGVQIVAVEVAYTAPGIQTKDITSNIISEMQASATPDPAAPTQPQLQPQPQQ